MRQNPGIQIELVGIETKGDLITDRPLHKLEGKDFFVKELDDALLSGRIDFSVHSLKDLSLERPTGIALAAIPEREDPRDVIVFHERVIERLKSGQTIRIGTSAPRRLQNIPGFLRVALPRFSSEDPNTTFVEIRGNVNTRLSRLHTDDPERQLDGAVLALAGLSRLYAHPTSHGELMRLLDVTRFMVLPLTKSPAAPSQGALAIECREDDAELRHILAKIHDCDTAASIKVERDLMAAWGGGCHQRFGITSVVHSELGRVTFKRGLLPSNESIEEVDFISPPDCSVPGPYVDGMKIKPTREPLPVDLEALSRCQVAVVANPNAVTDELRAYLPARLWCVGLGSWEQLAREGLWVEGCAERLGIGFIERTLACSVLGVPRDQELAVLTHQDAAATWQMGQVFSPYRVHYDAVDGATKKALSEAKHIYWSSGAQFLALRSYVAPGCIHACGAGKTVAQLRAAGVSEVNVFPSNEAWLKWLGH